ncbi:hypothetical protein [Tautonia plasticadhaerens]|uniref:Uncharacterized protein n=1 Tax=Tautonia plasticadhaerens TaxID=2527974 RepID=A0A518HAS6_9BACT|nr:hypothetical protein [Tautonia plasticadhaerens]QDV37948.1 hypothetical protein ElP_58950 [Tautonia plasticadhaerens]
MSMRTCWTLLLALAAAPATGCHRQEFLRNRSVDMDPPLVSADPIAGDPALAEPRSATLADRHPLFRKPAEYYQSAGPSPVRKVAAATVIGIPAGILGEMRQIVVGCPPGF